MSTSNNLDEKVLLGYITGTLRHWGMLYVTEQTLKQAKKNDPDCIQHLTRLLFDLVILHIFDFDYLPEELKIIFQDDQEMMQVILAHLYESGCPSIICYPDEEQGQNVVGFDFSSSRHILITCGWVMAVSDFFTKTADKLIKKKFKQIYKPKPLNLGALSKKYTIPISRLNLHEGAPALDRVSYLSKALRSRKYSVQCLIAKRNKILKRITMDLKALQGNLTIDDIFSTSNSQEVQALQNQLRELILFSKQNMNYRKYWWIWLDQKIISLSYQDLSKQYEQFEKRQVVEGVKLNVAIDLHYPRKYVEKCQEIQLQLDAISDQIEQLNLKPRKIFKDIDRDIAQEIQEARQGVQGEQVPSFVGMQLRQYLGVGMESKAKDGKQLKKASDKSSKRLKQSIREFISQLEGIVML